MFITKADLEKGNKRFNVLIDLKTARMLGELLEENANIFPGTLCKMYLTEIIHKKYKEAFKHSLPGQTSLFDKTKKKVKKISK